MTNKFFLSVLLSIITPIISFSMENNANQSEYELIDINQVGYGKEKLRDVTIFYNFIKGKIDKSEIKCDKAFFKHFISSQSFLLPKICNKESALFFVKNDIENDEVVDIKISAQGLKKLTYSGSMAPKQYNVIVFKNLYKKPPSEMSKNFLIYKNVVNFLITQAVIQSKKYDLSKQSTKAYASQNFSVICVATEKTPQEYFNSIVEEILTHMKNSNIKTTNEDPNEKWLLSSEIIIKDFIEELFNMKKKRKKRTPNNKNNVVGRENKLNEESSNNNIQAKKLKNSIPCFTPQSQMPFYHFSSVALNTPEESQPIFIDPRDGLYSETIPNQNLIMNSNSNGHFLQQDPIVLYSQNTFQLFNLQPEPENLVPQNQVLKPLSPSEKAKFEYILNQEDLGIDGNDSDEE